MPSYAIRLSIAGPLMATGLETFQYGIDAPFLRDADGKRFVLPGTQLRGVLRHVMLEMSSAAPDKLERRWIDRLFGSASGDADNDGFDGPSSGWEPKSGILTISDLAAPEPSAGRARTMTRIAINDFTGSVEHGHLQVLEQPAGINDVVIFEGRVTINADEDSATALVGWIEKALALVPAIGANKSAGFGRIVAQPVLELIPAVPAVPAVQPDALPALAEAGPAELVLEFDGPFLVSADRWNSNLISGQSRVSGAALKAVVAQMTGARAPDHPLHGPLAQVIFRELRPAKPDAARPRTPSLSFFAVEGENELLDGFSEDPELYASISGGNVAFLPDIKPDDPALSRLLSRLGETFSESRYIRTRTAINANGTADAGKLFTYSAVKPGGHVWKGSLHRGSASAESFSALLAALPARVEGFGKTRVSARLTVVPAKHAAPAPTSGKVMLVLETPACLHTPEDLFAFPEEPDADERLRLQYQAYFASALRSAAAGSGPTFRDSELDLRFFAQQKRVGGYIAARYPVFENGYYPWILTVAGSAFELTLPDGYDEALPRLIESGLPVPVGFDGERRTWRGNPFVPENGYGEIRLLEM